jgi:hypothetical protein
VVLIAFYCNSENVRPTKQEADLHKQANDLNSNKLG